MSTPGRVCASCGERVRLGEVALGLLPPRVKCPKCGDPLGGLSFARLPSVPFLIMSLVLGLAVGIAFGTVVTLLSREWPYSYRFALLGVSLVAGALLILTSAGVTLTRRKR